MKYMHSAVLGFTILAISSPASADYDTVWTDQGWGSGYNKDAEVWYDATQGSRLIRMDWFKSLGQIYDKFGAQEMDTLYGFPSASSADDLAIGFVPDVDQNETAWLGLNCSACHTSRLKYQDQEVLIHGGQSFGDFRAFLVDLTSVVRTVSKSEDMRGELYQTLPQNGGYADELALQADLEDWLAHRDEIDRVLDGLDENQGWGYGRADAVGYIQSATRKIVQKGPSDYVSTANAPVNYPVVWNANQQGALQHNGLVSNGTDLSIFGENFKIGALLRNMGEAIGVFVKAEMDDQGVLTTSINGPNLLKIEKSLATLQSPVWPSDILGSLNPDLIARGATVYQESCVACHGVVEDVTDLTVPYPLDLNACSKNNDKDRDGPFVCVQPVVDRSLTKLAQQADLPPSKRLIGTDPMMTCNIMLHQIQAGKLEGKTKKNALSLDAYDEFGETAFTNQIMASLILQDLKTQLPDLFSEYALSEVANLGGVIRTWFGLDEATTAGLKSEDPDLNEREELLSDCAEAAIMLNGLDPDRFPLPGYKSRPLNGVWASAPYLHNGSVPSLFDLLQEPQNRPKTFNVPNGNFDPLMVGLAQDAGGFVFNVEDETGQGIVGNSNLGHNYGTEYSDADKMALVEYLKSL